ncbi:glycosyltransferase family 61 protein [Helicobacter sp. 11S03491-1]|uniref:glycosyltransferase family 61 protein n=1 Tax=Helicobacter sp. 11S03491-1 TaxID=1476196 RepID=UPI000BA53EED|nr:glycosyltransferase family 61 protein [Helicobacter sp. 11S03491-1]PAF41224.1 hypothetical protein BKH45_07625 [Helicobacter sp. 11S03491-1]
MEFLKLKISPKIKNNTLEYKSIFENNKLSSIPNVAKNSLRTLKAQKNLPSNSLDYIDYNIPIDPVEIMHFPQAMIGDCGGIFVDDKIIYESLDGYNNQSVYAKNKYAYLKDLSLLNLHSKQDIKNYLKLQYFKIKRFIIRDKRLQSQKPKILFFEPWFGNMYHFIFESYPRLIIALDYFKEQNIKDFYIICPPIYSRYETYYKAYIQDILDLEKIHKNQIIYLEYQNAKTCNLYMPTCPRLNAKYVLPALDKLKDHFYDPTFIAPSSRIYISRQKSNYRFLSNEEEIYQILHDDYGFLRVYMEDLSLKEKINLMLQAEIVMSVDGTSLINGCFMTKPNSKLIALRLYEMSELQLFVPSLFQHIEYLPIVCEIAEKIGENIWTQSNLYLHKNTLIAKLNDYDVKPIK